MTCVAVVLVILVIHAPRAVSSFDGEVSADAYITNDLTRLTTTGDALGIPNALQVEALAELPKNSTYVLLLPSSAETAAKEQISSLAIETAPAFLLYLLLPSQPAPLRTARYVICFGCDLEAWTIRARWLWQANGDAVGKLIGR